MIGAAVLLTMTLSSGSAWLAHHLPAELVTAGISEAEVAVTSIVFPQQLTLEQARREAMLRNARHVEWVDEICQLTQRQRSQLQLAARGDLERVLTQVGLIIVQYDAAENVNKYMEQHSQTIFALRKRYASELPGADSLFEKSKLFRLSAEQLGQLSEALAERQDRQYAVTVHAMVSYIDQSLPMTVRQRDGLVNLIVQQGMPPLFSANSEMRFALVLYQLTQIPEQELHHLFVLENERAFVDGLVEQVKDFQPMLVQAGLLEQ